MLWRSVIRPLLFCLPAELAHELSMKGFGAALSFPGVARCVQSRYQVLDQRLQTRLFGIDFQNPVGLAAGFDKNGVWFEALRRLGFGCVEIGTLTAREQPGNSKPRLFRLPDDRALINRLGFNNRGSAWAAKRLARKSISHPLGINIGKSRVTELADAAIDYRQSFERLFPFASYFTINVSSPNTPGLRDLQNRGDLTKIIGELQQANRQLAADLGLPTRPILLKIAPDLTDQQLDEIADLGRESRLDGMIATNTTVSRAGLQTGSQTIERIGAGGLSGGPLTQRSREVVARLFAKLGQQIPIIGCGGILNGENAWQMINAGASLVQVYTGFIYGGPGFIRDVNRYLLHRLEEAGLASISECVGKRLT